MIIEEKPFLALVSGARLVGSGVLLAIFDGIFPSSVVANRAAPILRSFAPGGDLLPYTRSLASPTPSTCRRDRTPDCRALRRTPNTTHSRYTDRRHHSRTITRNRRGGLKRILASYKGTCNPGHLVTSTSAHRAPHVRFRECRCRACDSLGFACACSCCGGRG